MMLRLFSTLKALVCGLFETTPIDEIRSATWARATLEPGFRL